MKCLPIALLVCTTFLSAQQSSTKEPAMAATTAQARPKPDNFKTYEDYIEAIVDWKLNLSKAHFAEASKPGTLAACKARLKDALDSRDAATNGAENVSEEKERLAKEKADLASKNAELTKKYEELRAAAHEVLTYTQKLDGEYRKMLVDHGSLVDNYNSLLGTAQRQQQQLNMLSSRQQQFNNALAIYSLMPKYTPPQTLNVNVTDCTKYPALCVH